jgi:hypothetical protein
MNLERRLKTLERLKLKSMIHKDCICSPADEPPCLHPQAERESAKAVLCPIHGLRFPRFAPTVFVAILKPTQLTPGAWTRRSKQYRKAMEASFPTDRWPPIEFPGPGPVIRYVLKDGTEVHRLVLHPVYDCRTNLPIFEQGKQAFEGPYNTRMLLEPPKTILSETDSAAPPAAQ